MSGPALVTPDDVAKALRLTPQEYTRMHNMNVNHPMVSGCKLGTVFSHNGEYYIYVGVNGRNRKYPMIAYRVSDWSRRKMGAQFFTIVKKASV